MMVTPELRRRILLVSAAAIVPVSLNSLLVTAQTKSEMEPSVYGWWSQTSVGVVGSPEPDVPEGGMLVQNLFTGPSAISALRFSLPDQATANQLSLAVSGTPVINQPPFACLATTGFGPSDGGAWEDRPEYDCEQSVPGVISADGTHIEFAVGRLAEKRSLSIVIQATGPTDRIVFAKPGPDTLTVSGKSGAKSPPPSEPDESEPADQAGSSSTAGAPAPVAPPAPPAVAPIPPQSTGDVPAPTGVPPIPGPSASPSAQPGTLVADTDDTGQGGSASRVVGTAFGVLLLLLCILYWSDGFGAVALRSSLAARHQAGKV